MGEDTNSSMVIYVDSKATSAVDAILQADTPFDSKVVPELEQPSQEENAFGRDLEHLERSLPDKQVLEVVPAESVPASPFEELLKTFSSTSSNQEPKETPHQKQSGPVKEAVTDEVILDPISSSGIEQTDRTERPFTNTDASLPSVQPASTQVMAMASQLRELKARLQAQSRATGIKRIDDRTGTQETIRQASHLP
jgi:hypothetical protein